jgi:hypothetical protein
MKFFFGKWDSRVLNGFGQLAGEEGLKLTEMCQESMNRYAGDEGKAFGRIAVSRLRRFRFHIPLRFHRLNSLGEKDNERTPSIADLLESIYFAAVLLLSVGEAFPVPLKMSVNHQDAPGISRRM